MSSIELDSLREKLAASEAREVQLREALEKIAQNRNGTDSIAVGTYWGPLLANWLEDLIQGIERKK